MSEIKALVYVGLICQFIFSIAVFFIWFVMAGFHSESYRGTLNNPLSAALSVLTALVAFTPFAVTLYSSYQLFFQKTAPTFGFIYGIAVGIVCLGICYGLFLLDEFVAPKAYAANKQKQIESLQAEAQKGDGKSACELVRMETKISDSFFSVCKSYLESLHDDSALWTELQKFTVGSSFISRTLETTDGSEARESVIPAEHQEWFLNLFFDQLLKAPPANERSKVTTAPTKDFADILCAGNLLQSLVKSEWNRNALHTFAQNKLPAIEQRYAQRLHDADAVSKSLTLQDGWVDQKAAGYSSAAESAFNNAKWFRSALEALKAF